MLIQLSVSTQNIPLHFAGKLMTKISHGHIADQMKHVWSILDCVQNTRAFRRRTKAIVEDETEWKRNIHQKKNLETRIFNSFLLLTDARCRTLSFYLLSTDLFSLFYEFSIFNFCYSLWFGWIIEVPRNREWQSTRGVPMNVTFETEQEEHLVRLHVWGKSERMTRARVRFIAACSRATNQLKRGCAAMGAQCARARGVPHSHKHKSIEQKLFVGCGGHFCEFGKWTCRST